MRFTVENRREENYVDIQLCMRSSQFATGLLEMRLKHFYVVEDEFYDSL